MLVKHLPLYSFLSSVQQQHFGFDKGLAFLKPYPLINSERHLTEGTDKVQGQPDRRRPFRSFRLACIWNQFPGMLLPHWLRQW